LDVGTHLVRGDVDPAISKWMPREPHRPVATIVPDPLTSPYWADQRHAICRSHVIARAALPGR
jgi:hypothetical protein